jgi:hypothetical protein
MSTFAAHCAHPAFAVESAVFRSPFVRGIIAGSVQGLTAWHVVKVIVGAGESGACLHAHNVVRQRSVSPGAELGILIDQSPICGLKVAQLPRNLRMRAIELRLLQGFLSGVLLQPVDHVVAIGERASRVVALPLGCGDIRSQSPQVGGARARRSDDDGCGAQADSNLAQPVGSLMAAAAAAPCAAYRS